jgi:hypothetical protein
MQGAYLYHFQRFKEQFVGQAKGGGQFVDVFGR